MPFKSFSTFCFSSEAVQQMGHADKRKPSAVTSTPAVKPKRALLETLPDVSEISSAESVDYGGM